MLAPEVIDPTQFGPVGRSIDIYHAGLLLLCLALNRVANFTRDEILAGGPREAAETCGSKYGPAIAIALRRHTASRFQTPLDFWRAVSAAT